MIVILHRRVHPVIAGLIGLTLLASIVAAIDARHGGGIYGRVALIPARVWEGELWRLASWVLVEPGPLWLIGTCLCFYRFGTDLVLAWGTARFWRFVATVVLGSAAATCLIGLVLDPAWRMPHLGGTVLVDAFLIAWATKFPDARVELYGMLVLGGPLLAYGTLAVTTLFAVFGGVARYLPELITAVGVLLYTNGSHRGLRPRLRRLRRRRRGAPEVIPGDRHGGPYVN